MSLVSCAFVAATQAINALVGPAVGRVLIMALLMLQLVSAGGMYPVQTTSRPFQILHRFDPMAFGVNGCGSSSWAASISGCGRRLSC